MPDSACPRMIRIMRSGQKIKRLLKWTVRVVVAVCLLALVALTVVWLWGGPYAQRTIHAKLQKLIGDHLNATLEMGAIHYSYPYGVVVDHVALVATPENEPAVTLASFKQLRLQLVELPFGDGPLKIASIQIDEPTVHIIRTPGGIVGQTGLVKSEEQKRKRNATKLSDVFVLHHLAMIGGELRYEDRRDANPDDAMVWRGLNIVIDSQATGASHRFKLAGSTGDLARISSAGNLDLDTLVLDLDSLAISCELIPNQKIAALPPELTGVLERFKIAGRASVHVAGSIPLRSLTQANATATLTIEDGQARYPNFNEPLQDLDITCSATLADGDLNLKLERLDFRSNSTGLSVQPFNILTTPEKRTWTASAIRIAAAYVPNEATKPILDQSATLFVVARAEQAGEMHDVTIRLDGSSLALPNLNDELKLTSQIDVRLPLITVQPSVLTGLEGRTEFDGTFNTDTHLTTVNAQMLGLSLGSLTTLVKPSNEREVAGRLRARVSGQMTGRDLDTVTGEGTFQVRDGRFASVPVLTQIARFLRIGEKLFVAETLSGQFTVENRRLTFQRVAISSNAVRVRGTGWLGFDQQTDLRLYVIGTDDWAKGVRSTGVPIVSDLAGLLVGGAQGVVRGVTRQFTSVHVTGTVGKISIVPDPAPSITDPVKKLFDWEGER